MIRGLVTIAIAGLLTSIVCISAAIAIGGPDLLAHNVIWSPAGHGWRVESHGDHWTGTFDLGGHDDEPVVSRTQAWTGGERLEVDAPVNVRFTQGDGPAALTLRGPKAALDRLVVEGGRIRFDSGVAVAADDVTVELTAPKVVQFEVAGSGDLDIRNYRQDSLSLKVTGSGDVTAQGAAKSVQAATSGSGDADLSQLSVDGADVRISGSGSTTVGPRAWAKVDISGSGDVTLTSRPPKVESHVTGSGDVQQGEAVVPRADAGPARAT
jgi:hypothetical protein